MKENRRNRINELKLGQKQKQLVQTLESRNYPPLQLLSSITEEEIWDKINQGKVIEKVEEINLEPLQKQIGQFFSAREKLGTVLYFSADSFVVQFNTIELIRYSEKLIEDLSKETLLYWFVFSIDLYQILLLEESEYGYYELIYYDEKS